jgi:hypothetical protein
MAKSKLAKKNKARMPIEFNLDIIKKTKNELNLDDISSRK